MYLARESLNQATLDRAGLDGRFNSNAMMRRLSMLCFARTRSRSLDSLLDYSGRAHHAQLGSSAGDTNNDPDIVELPRKAFRCPGINDNFASVSDAAPLRITGAIVFGGYFDPDDFTPAAGMGLVGKYVSAGDERSYYLLLNTNGTLGMSISTNGEVGAYFDNSSVAVTVRGWWAASLDVSATTSAFWISSDPRSTPIEDVEWTELGDPNDSAPASINAGSADFLIGAQQTGSSSMFTGLIGRAFVQSGAVVDGKLTGTNAFDWDPSDIQSPYLTDTEDSVNGATVTINQSGTAELARIVGIHPAAAWLDTDAYFEIDNETKVRNIGTNPELGIDTTGWDVPGTGTIERVSLADEGIPTDGLPPGVTHALKCTKGDDRVLGRYSPVITAAEHFGTIYTFIPSTNGIDPGGNLTFTDFGSYGSATGTQSTVLSSEAGVWARPGYDITPDGGDLNGNFAVVDNSIQSTVGTVIYITALLIELAGTAAPYVSGAQRLGRWEGAVHASASVTRVDLDLEVDESGAWFHVGRTYDTTPAAPEILFGKKDGTGSSEAGWNIFSLTGSGDVRSLIADGAATGQNETPVLTAGQLYEVAGRRDVPAAEVVAALDGVPSLNAGTDNTTVTLANDFPGRAGADSGVTPAQFQQGETMALAFVNNHEYAALTDSEMKLVEQGLVAGVAA